MTDTPGDGAPAKSARIPADTFAHRLMLTRAHAGHLSIREAAERTGLGRGSWTNWEKGTMPVDLLYVVETISEAFGVDPVWLLEGGALAEPETRSRRMRWSTVRPTHGRREAGEGVQPTLPNPKLTRSHVVRPTGRPSTERPTADRPRDNRPTGRPHRPATTPQTRRPAPVVRPAA